ncbi:interferon-related developmental regulator-domain-containing protein [Coniella lustricola]|uniref:Interferon-related developmental regulator-domain-containing protein n=1 Tax=Coniella lustricola TaxID=2025994 RepID=A0A2T3A5X4_9PEZI|nr:interferon-related developmental regulator-domain-containing protein [Coniella lustricola]
MHDLRKKALLESGKTVSRKARTRPDSKAGTPITSPSHSPHASRNVSRAGSRYASEDEGSGDSDLDDVMTLSTYSGSDHGADDSGNIPNDRAWAERLQARVSQIVLGGRSGERKKISNAEREDMLKSYLHLIRHYYGQSEIQSSMNDLVTGLMRAVRFGVSASERTLALKALAVTILTNPTDTVLSDHVTTLKSIVEQEDEEEEVKVAALYSLATAAMYGDGSTEAAEDMLQYMIEIVESDGHTVNSPDAAGVVVAALKSWGFIAAHLEDLSEQSEQAMEAFVEQLDSTDAYVQTAAGENIALLFETAREMEEESGEKMNFQYDPKKLAQQMRDISKGSKSISKRDRRHLKGDFSSIATGLERGKGPGYSTAGRPASNPNKGGSVTNSAHGDDVNEFGYRQTIFVGKEKITIDSWAFSNKVDFVRIVLAGGFPTHLAKNDTVQEML